MFLGKRRLTYSLAINEALHQSMEEDEQVFLIGQGVKSPWYVGNTASGLLDRFGPARVIDTPVSENAVTGAAVGAALVGMRPIVVHPRMDFMLYAMDPIINEAANWHYMSGGNTCVPLVIWAIVNRGGEQAAQHSQSLHAMFAHVPGLKVVMPSNPYDAKGLLLSAIAEDNPVLFVDDRWLYSKEGSVPVEPYSVPIGKAVIRQEGVDCTLIASSYSCVLAEAAARDLLSGGISVELIDIRSLKPLDIDLICSSVMKTHRLVIVDGGWRSYGAAAEIAAVVSENLLEYLEAPIKRVTLPDSPAPASRSLEEAYYPTAERIVSTVEEIITTPFVRRIGINV